MTISKTTEANRTYGTIVLRGGRLTKWKGKPVAKPGTVDCICISGCFRSCTHGGCE